MLVVFGLLFSASCSKDPVEDPQQFDYFIDAEFLQTIPSAQAQFVLSVLTGMTDLFPGDGAHYVQLLSEIGPLAVYDADIYKITYRTTFNENEVTASGLVCVPRRKTSDERFPILNFQNGTIVLHANAPSVNFRNDQSMQFIATLSTAGFVIVIPDQLGFGASANMHHPYFHKESTVKATLDMIAATREMTTAIRNERTGETFDFDLSGDISVMGYSQGGSNTVFLGEALHNNAQGLDLRYAAAGGGAYSILRMFEKVLALETYERPDYLGYVLQSVFRTYDPGIQYAGRINTLYDGKHSNNQIIAQLTTNMKELFREDFIHGYETDPKFAALRQLMAINSPEAWATEAAVMIRAARGDEQVPYTESVALYEDFTGLGVGHLIDYGIYPYDEMGHVEAAFPFFIEAFHAILKSGQPGARKSRMLSGHVASTSHNGMINTSLSDAVLAAQHGAAGTTPAL